MNGLETIGADVLPALEPEGVELAQNEQPGTVTCTLGGLAIAPGVEGCIDLPSASRNANAAGRYANPGRPRSRKEPAGNSFRGCKGVGDSPCGYKIVGDNGYCSLDECPFGVPSKDER